MDPITDIYDDQEPPRSSCLRRLLYIAISLLLVAGLLATSLGAVAWVIQRVQETFPDEITSLFTDPTPRAVPTIAGAGSSTPENLTPEGVVATATAVSPATVAPFIAETDERRLVYITEGGQVATIAPDGTDQVQLTSGTINYRFPAWSPDGTTIAAIGARSSRNRGLYTIDVETAVSQRLFAEAEGAPIYFSWSPDGRQIGFLTDQRFGSLALYTTPLNGEGALLATGSPLYWGWSASAQQIFIHVGDSEEGPKLVLTDSDNVNLDKNLAEPGAFRTPAISADGRYLAFAEQVGFRDSRLILLDTQTGSEQQVAHDGLLALSWQPDGHQLAFIAPVADSDGDFLGPLSLLNAETGTITRLLDEPIIAFFWSPNGRYIATLQADQNNPTRRVQEGADTGASAAKPVTQIRIPALTLSVIDIETGAGRRLLTFQPSPIFLSQYLPFFDQYALSHPLWAPTSDALVLPFWNGSSGEITIVPTNGGDARPIAVGDMAFWRSH